MDAAACKPGPAVIACRMLEDELLLAMRRTGKEYPVAWLESSLHETPQLLHAALMEAIAAYDGRYGVLLLAMGACGNAVDGIGAAHSTLVLPRFQDCIGLLLDEPRASDAFYLTRGWLRGERALPCAYRRARERYGEKTARAVYEIMLRNYAAFSLLDTGAYPLSECRAEPEQLAACFDKALTTSRGTLSTLEKLLLGQWDGDAFCTVAPGARFSLLDTLMGGGIHQ